MTAPRVSAVIPAHNCARFLPQAIDSALAQEGAALEVVVVDDGSTDATPDVLASYAGRVVALRQANRGPSAARNAGIAASTGEFVAFLDADDTWEREKTRAQLAYLERHPACGLVFCDAYLMDEAGHHLAPLLGPRTGEVPTGSCLRELFQGNFVLIPGVMVRRSVLERTGGFDERLRNAEDYDLWLRVAEIAEIGLVPEPLAAWRKRAGQASGQRDAMLRGEARALEKALARSPSLKAGARRRFARLHDESGWLDLAEGRRGPALRKFLRALRHDPTWEKPYRHLLATALATVGVRHPYPSSPKYPWK
ncbi:MAG TPA: glycosyltransferase [Candidatus Polarisedimenticolaceae bacterium]|nr:glycosyltransferase [Candidatus Polarisedimenticolaceae bacterium]